MDDDLILFTELEAMILKFKKMRDRTAINIKAHYFTVVITALEQALAYYGYFIIGVPLNIFTKNKEIDNVEQ